MNQEIQKKNELNFEKLVELFEKTQSSLQKQAARSVDIALVVRNWLFGWYIVEFEHGGAERVELYGKKLIKRLSDELTMRLGKGFSKRSLEQFRRFYECYNEIAQTVSAQLASKFMLGWSHYVTLLTIDSPDCQALLRDRSR